MSSTFTILWSLLVGAAAQSCVNPAYTIISSRLTCSQKQLLLDLHNKYRNDVAGGKVVRQPPASDMLEMVWDNSVAKSAQTWSDTCEFEHDPNLELPNGEIMGQNLALIGGTRYTCDDSSIESMVQSWFNENKVYRFGSRFSQASGHYTQLVWGGSSKVGCGLTSYTSRGSTFCYLTCNYLPAGNWLGKTPYTTGRKNCKAKEYNSKKYPNLCSLGSSSTKPLSGSAIPSSELRSFMRIANAAGRLIKDLSSDDGIADPESGLAE